MVEFLPATRKNGPGNWDDPEKRRQLHPANLSLFIFLFLCCKSLRLENYAQRTSVKEAEQLCSLVSFSIGIIKFSPSSVDSQPAFSVAARIVQVLP